MDGFMIDRATVAPTARTGPRTTKSYQGDASISIILESTTTAGVGPRLHQHPYAETFIIRRGWATFTIGSEELQGHAGAGPCGAR